MNIIFIRDHITGSGTPKNARHKPSVANEDIIINDLLSWSHNFYIDIIYLTMHYNYHYVTLIIIVIQLYDTFINE